MSELDRLERSLNKIRCQEKKERKQKAIKKKSELAIAKTKKVEDNFNQLENILLSILDVKDLGWDVLIDNGKHTAKKPQQEVFSKKKPVVTEYNVTELQEPVYKEVPREPTLLDRKYQVEYGVLEKLIAPLKSRRERLIKKAFRNDYAEWEEQKEKVDLTNRELKSTYDREYSLWELNKKIYAKRQLAEVNEWEKEKELFDKNIETLTLDWEQNKLEFENSKNIKNEKISDKKNKYLAGDTSAITFYFRNILSLANSIYPKYFPKKRTFTYDPVTKILVIDCTLPSIDKFPTEKSFKYIKSRDYVAVSYLSSALVDKMYDSVLYKMSLREMYLIYVSDEYGYIDSIVFNGWVNSVDSATGRDVRPCIMSVQSSKDEFLAINLKKVDPKECFKMLKGVGSSKLHGMAAVAPIIFIDKKDKRFVSSYDVANDVVKSTNLAAMDWQDFENLIREVFEKEFSQNGGEVKITQASRDGGVDAIAFDPDPIRGGKIVIQAKRYTNVVGVSAVRDLYGTVMNEGATKGILVTTANYGPDAYNFSKGKPLTLMNGGNLLHLLEKHGTRAKIDLKEAKIILAEQQET